jgi:hypothetical protein
MKATLQQREKKNEKERELRRVYETLTGAATDIFRRMVVVADEKGRDLENIQPFINELNELRLFINDALDVLRRRYNSTIRGFSESWDRNMLKKNRDDKANVEIKTPFGLFNDVFELLLADFVAATVPLANEDGFQKFKHIGARMTKARRLARDFPRLTTNTQALAESVISYFEYKLNTFIYAGGTRASTLNLNYYTTRAENSKTSVEAWQNAAATLELVVKPLNTIV